MNSKDRETQSPIRLIAVMVSDSVGGICRYSHEIANALCKDGHDVVLVSRPDYPVFENSLYRRAPILLPRFSSGKLSALDRLRSKARFLAEQVLHPLRLFNYCRHNGINFALMENLHHIGYFIWVWWIPRGLVLGVTVHDIARKQGNWFRGMLDSQLLSVYKKASILFVHDEKVADKVKEITGIPRGRMYVVPLGVFPHEQEGTASDLSILRDDGVKTGLFFGAIRDEKGLDKLINALHERRDSQGWRLVVAGTSPSGQHRQVAYYRDLAKKLDVVGQVIFIDDYIPDADVWKYFSISDWVALNYDETFTSQSAVLASAVFFRKPILVSKAPLLIDTVTRFQIGVVCESNEASHLLTGIRELEERSLTAFNPGFEMFMSEMSWLRNAQITLSAFSEVGLGKAESSAMAVRF